MKKLMIVFLFLSILFTGCSDYSISYSLLERDSYKTGGNLSFEYDQDSKTAYFGGEGEFVEYYTFDIAKGWTEEGNRIGFKLLVPNEVDDYYSIKAVLNNKEYKAEQFIVGDEVKYALFQPLIDENNLNLTLKIQWKSGAKEQVYRIIIKKDVKFLNKT